MDEIVVFLHNDRTGGMTLRDILQRHFSASQILGGGGGAENLELLGSSEELQNPGIGLIEGRFPFGVHRYTTRPCSYITLVRQPVIRVVSLFDFQRQKWELKLRREDILPMPDSIEEYVFGGNWLEVDNGQTRRVSGLSPEFGQCSEETLEVAKDNLRRHFSSVGITDRFDEFLILLNRVFGWKNLAYSTKNARPDRVPPTSLTAETLRRIEELNRFDFELYAFVKDMLDEAIENSPKSFLLKLEGLRRANRGLRGARRDQPGGHADYRPRNALDGTLEEQLVEAYAELFENNLTLHRRMDKFKQLSVKHRRLTKVNRKLKQKFRAAQMREKGSLSRLDEAQAPAVHAASAPPK